MRDRRPLLDPAVATLVTKVANLAAIVALASCVDTTHDDQVQALGGEAAGVAPGPSHRPGQPCLVCHGGEGPASEEFSVAGTVYAVFGQSAPAVGAGVRIEDITGGGGVVQTNAAGNFYVASSGWRPTYPIQMQVSLGPATHQMLTHVGREGSCADCHQSLVGPASPGPVYVATNMAELVADGGTSP